MIKNKKGTSLVELIAVVVIMGIIAGIAVPTTIAVINRQKVNSVLASLESIYRSAKNELSQVSTGIFDDCITVINDSFYYISLTTLLDNGMVDGEKYRPVGSDIYFCFDESIYFVQITSSSVSTSKPTTTGSTVVDGVNVTYDCTNNKFIKA